MISNEIIQSVALLTLIIIFQYLKNRENMAMIERGINPRATPSSRDPFKTLKFALIFLGTGLGLFIAYLAKTFIVHEDAPVLWLACSFLGCGTGLYISYTKEKNDMRKDKDY